MGDRPFAASASTYDLLYAAAGKDYEREAADLHVLIGEQCPRARTLLDVACGTGAHLTYLRRWYEVTGVDVEPAMLEEAATRLPGVELIRGDMRSFVLPQKFDVITCLFSAIGYLQSTVELDEAIETMKRHLCPADSSSSTVGSDKTAGETLAPCRRCRRRARAWLWRVSSDRTARGPVRSWTCTTSPPRSTASTTSWNAMN